MTSSSPLPPALPGTPAPSAQAPLPQPAPSNRGCLIALLVAGVVALLLLAALAALITYGVGVFKNQAQEAMQEHPVIDEHIGTIHTVSLDWAGSLADQRKNGYTFDIEGDRGSGTVNAIFETVHSHREQMGEGTLVMADGTRLALERLDVVQTGAVDGVDSGPTEESDALVFQACREIRNHSEVVAALGPVQECLYNQPRSMELAGEKEFAFDIEGERGNGRVEADFITVDADHERMENAVLVMPNGRRQALANEPGTAAERVTDDAEQEPPFVFQACREIRNHSGVSDALGTVKRCIYNNPRSMELQGEIAFAFDIEGERGDGRVEADFITVDADNERMENAVLVLPDGRRIELPDVQ